MKFIINQLLIWENPGESKPLSLPFIENKVNVITGGSNTGKTSILKIIDYCLFGKSNQIPDDINDRVSFYGVQITINDKRITIGRASKSEFKKTSEDYYFSESGEIPERSPIFLLAYLVKDSVIKAFLEKEYLITEQYELIKVGGKIKEGSKLKLEYFSIFNTISQSLILDEENFFDFQLNNRDGELYREVLTSIFDLCIGLRTKEVYTLNKEISTNRDKLASFEKKKDNIEKKIKKEEEYIRKLIYKAKEIDLVDDEIDEDNLNEAFWILENRTNLQYTELHKISEPDDFKRLDKERYNLKQRIRNLSKLKKEIEDYSLIEKQKEDSLKPIEYIFKNTENLINEDGIKFLVDQLKNELYNIRNSLTTIPKSEIDINTEIENTFNRLKEVESQLEKYPSKKEFINFNPRHIKLIEIRKDIEFFLNEKPVLEDKDVKSIEEEIKGYTKIIEELVKKLPEEDEATTKERRIGLLNELIQNYYGEVKESLDKYSDYKPVFNTRNMELELIKPNDDKPSNISGSSNFLFLQLCLFLGLHEIFIKKKIKNNFVPQYIIIDYPSLPYKSNDVNNQGELKSDSDRDKLRSAFELLNNFIDKITGKNEGQYNESFQIIILEHINPDIWEKPTSLSNFHLVQEFRDGKSLLGF